MQNREQILHLLPARRIQVVIRSVRRESNLSAYRLPGKLLFFSILNPALL